MHKLEYSESKGYPVEQSYFLDIACYLHNLSLNLKYPEITANTRIPQISCGHRTTLIPVEPTFLSPRNELPTTHTN